jgi:plasmid stabilization system protein ParE
MTYQIAYSRRARLDLLEILIWLSGDSDETADLWDTRFQEAVDSLEQFPARCPLVRSGKPRNRNREIRRLLFEQYEIIFAIEGSTVRIIHVRHQKQEPLDEI